MVLIVPKIYYGIKEKGRREGIREGREEARLEAREKARLEAVDSMLAAMREAGIDEETRRRVEDIHAKRQRAIAGGRG